MKTFGFLLELALWVTLFLMVPVVAVLLLVAYATIILLAAAKELEREEREARKPD